MSFQMKASKGGDGAVREKVPAGNHPAVLVALIDLGEQHHEFAGEAKWNRDVYLVFEFPTKKDTTGKPFLLAESVTLSLNEKAKLRKWCEGITGKVIPDGSNFDVSSLLGKSCLVNVILTEKSYPRVKDVTGCPEGLTVPAPTHTTFACSLDEFRAGKTVPDWIPWMWSRALGKMASMEECIAASKDWDGPEPSPVEPAKPATPPVQTPPEQLWDYHDGKVWVKSQTAKQVAEHLVVNQLKAADVWVQHAGKRDTAKKADAYGFAGVASGAIPAEEVIPY